MSKQGAKERKAKTRKRKGSEQPARAARVERTSDGIRVSVSEGARTISSFVLTARPDAHPQDVKAELEGIVINLREHGAKLSKDQLAMCRKILGGEVRKRGRPRVVDPRISTHLQLTAQQRELCFAAAEHEGLSFAAWSRTVLLAKAREILRADPASPASGASS
jgi:hypothetical protein